MTDKERFEDIKKWYQRGLIDDEDIEWLINRVEELEKVTRRLEAAKDILSRDLKIYKNRVKELQCENIEQAERVQKLEKDLDEALDIGLKMEGEANEWERKAKRYKQALETIRNMFPMRGGTSYDKLSQIRKTAEKALEDDKNDR